MENVEAKQCKKEGRYIHKSFLQRSGWRGLGVSVFKSPSQRLRGEKTGGRKRPSLCYLQTNKNKDLVSLEYPIRGIWKGL